ncbi:MAG: hypothetical protein AAF730_13290 [Bacteroidota bacterium]
MSIAIAMGWVGMAQAQIIDDLFVSYYRMAITEISFLRGEDIPTLNRNYLSAGIGKGPFTIGVDYQITHGGTGAMASEQGTMLTAGYQQRLTSRWRVDVSGRLGVSPGINNDNPLYATDTDLNIRLVRYNPDGGSFLREYPIFPSAYVGGIVNEHGRVQAVVGAGAWWNQFNLYVTGYYALNGVEDPLNPRPEEIGRVFASLRNAGVNASLSYDIGNWTVNLRKNIPIENAGNEIVFGIRYRYFFR